MTDDQGRNNNYFGPERRHGDPLVEFRLRAMEEASQKRDDKIEEIAKTVTNLDTKISGQFEDLKKTLFERPVFVTYELLKIELESRDKLINRIDQGQKDGVTSSRYYVSLVITALLAIFGPVVVKQLIGN